MRPRIVANLIVLLLAFSSAKLCALDALGNTGAPQIHAADVLRVLLYCISTVIVVGALRIFSISRHTQVPKDFEKDVVHLADTKGIDAGISLCKEKPSSLARVLQAALVRYGAPLPQLEEAVRNETRRVRYELLRPTRLLSWLAMLAAALGILGSSAALIINAEFGNELNLESAARSFFMAFSDGIECLAIGFIVALLMIFFFGVTRARARDTAHTIEVRCIDAVVTLDRKARQSIRLIEDIEEKIKTESMIKVPDLSAEFDESTHSHESALKTAVTTHAGGAVQE